MSGPVVVTSKGAIRGVVQQGIARFMDVPYAAAPVAEARFEAPRPHAVWDGVREATAVGPNAPQKLEPFPQLDVTPLIGVGWIRGDDYLTVNVWTPDPGGAGLPVMVFIHGGGWVCGSNYAQVIDGAAFAAAGVVYMAINYRLGLEGFMPLDGERTNLGLRDQIFALQWIHENARAFGGDPDNLTVFGESAGAMSIADLVTSPLARGLMRRAIIQSGHGSIVRPIDIARRLTRKLAAMLGVSADAAGFKQRSAEACVQALSKVQKPTTRLDLRDVNGREPAFGISRFVPVYGDEVLPEPPLTALATGMGKDIKILIGTNAEEMNLYFVPTDVRGKLGRITAWYGIRRSEPRAWRILKSYGIGEPGIRPGDAFTTALTDLMFRLPARHFAAAHQGDSHFYEFNWKSPAFDGRLGACHALELPFVFNTLTCCSGPRGLVGVDPPQELANHIQALWVQFAHDGQLPWRSYQPDTRQVYSLTERAVKTDPDMPAAQHWP